MNTLGQFDTVPICHIRDMAKLILNRRDRNDVDDTIDAFIIQGLNRLKAPSNLVKKECKIQLTDQKVGKLPKGFSQLVALRVPCDARVENNSSLERNYDYFFYVDFDFLQSCDSTFDPDMVEYRTAFTIRNGYIYFNKEQGVDEIDLSYLGSNVDEDGFLLIYEKFAIALQFYAAYMFAVQNSNSEYNRIQIQDYQQNWLAQKRMIIADDLQNLWNLEKRNIRAIMQGRYWRLKEWV
jgi:hypothetical protein